MWHVYTCIILFTIIYEIIIHVIVLCYIYLHRDLVVVKNLTFYVVSESELSSHALHPVFTLREFDGAGNSALEW